MNFALTETMKEFRGEHERMLWSLPATGSAFKKVYFDPQLNRQTSIFVPAEDLVVPYGASDLDSAPRITHVMRKTDNDVRRLQVAGFWRDIDLGEPETTLDEVEKKIAEKMGFRATMDDRFKILEMCVNLDIEGYEHKDKDGNPTGIAIPYIVTIDKSSSKVLAIRRNWEPDDETYQKRQHFVHYVYVPGFGFYGLGLIHIVGGYARAGTSLIRQLVDAGTLSDLKRVNRDIRIVSRAFTTLGFVLAGLAITLPIALQTLEPDHLDTSKHDIMGYQGGPTVYGIELDAGAFGKLTVHEPLMDVLVACCPVGIGVVVWSDGAITGRLGVALRGVPVARPRTPEARTAALRAAWMFADEACLYDADEIGALYAACRWAVANGRDLAAMRRRLVSPMPCRSQDELLDAFDLPTAMSRP